MPSIKRVLLTGATGFVGSHLHPVLEGGGFEVVGATRNPDGAKQRFPERAFRRLDTADKASICEAMVGCDAAVYLVHSMADSKDYDSVEEHAATRFAAAAEEAQLKRIVYLGGIKPTGTPSRHLRSRLHTGEVLRAGGVPTVELQASMVIGAGSESFRMVRDLSARLPVMLLPSWLETRTEPVALDDVTAAITHALALSELQGGAYPLPGPEILTCREILERTALRQGLSPRMWGLPFVTPRLSSYWITLITRADKHVARELVEGLRHDLIAENEGFWRLFPGHKRLSFDVALQRALPEEERGLSGRARAIEGMVRRVTPHADKLSHTPS